MTPSTTALRRIATSEWFLVCLGFLLLGVALTWPMAINMTSGMWGVPSDDWGGVWGADWLHKTLFGPENFAYTDQLRAPDGMPIDGRFFQPMDKLYAWIFGGVAHGLLAVNLAIFMSYPLGGITMYALGKYLTDSRAAAALAGVIFVASPVHNAMSMAYNALSNVQWCPLVVLFTLMALRSGRKRDAALAGGSLALVWYASFYYGWFGVWLTILMLAAAGACNFAIAIRTRRVRSATSNGIRFFLTRGPIAAGTFALFVIPALYPLIQKVTTAPTTYARTLEDMQVNSVRPWSYFVPTVDHPIFGEHTSPFLLSHTGLLPIYESAMYIGVVAGFFALIGVLVRRRRLRGLPAASLSIPVITTLGIGAFVLTLGPFIPKNILSVDAWMNAAPIPHFKAPAFYLFQISPSFRYYGRAWVWGTVALASLAAIGFLVVEHRLRARRNWLPGVAAGALIALVLLDYANRPPLRWIDFTPRPAYLKAVAKLPKDAIVIDYPIAGFSTPRGLWYTLWQPWGEHPTINPPSDFAYYNLSNPDDPLTGQKLHETGIDYAVVHTKLPKAAFPPYQPDLPDDSLPASTGAGNPWFDEVATTRDSVIYKVRAKPRPIDVGTAISFGSGFHPEEFDGYSKFRWASTDAPELIAVVGPEPARTMLSFDIGSIGEKRSVHLTVDGRLVGTSFDVPVWSTHIAIPVNLQPGRHVIVLHSSPGIIPLSTFMETTDQRALSFRLSNVELTELDDMDVLIGTGFGPVEREKGSSHRWVPGDSASLLIPNTTSTTVNADLRITLGSYLHPKTIRVSLDGVQVSSMKIGTDERSTSTIPVRLRPGISTVKLTAFPGAEPIGGNDPRSIAFRLFSARIDH